MIAILHSAEALLASHAAPLAALAVALGLSLAGRWRRGRGKMELRAPMIGAVALLVGWGVLLGWPAVSRAIWQPHRGLEVLLAPAFVSAVVAGLLAWRGRRRRLQLGADAVFAGWWVAQAGVGPADFWRVWFAAGVMAPALGRMIAGDTMRGLAAAGALGGGLATSGAGAGWVGAALVAMAAWAGLLAAGKGAVVPSAAMAAVVAAADLAGGRLLRGRLDATDLACLSALAAPAVSGVISRKLGARAGRWSSLVAAGLAVVGLTGCVWLLRRAIFS